MEKESKEEVIEIEVEDVDALDEKWILMADGALNKFGAGLGIILITLDLSFIEHAIQLEFFASNNEVE